MGNLEFLLEFVFTVAAVTVPVVVGIRTLAGDESPEMPWPRGIEEEEPQRWNLDVLDRRSARRQPIGSERHSHRHPLPLSR
jgi:hypothetical protein